ncbi:hypothetical protein [Arcobacter peruensis]|uniref:hypothetical protein n=1 Tax=Arcobacter peruensis TaxID=2320140 RepID=UPI000F07B4B6|nr:hypothetical protein [Arcobacter peruensis]
MNGKIEVTYKLLCKNDVNKEISLKELLENEKIAKVIKNEFAKGFRNIHLVSNEESNEAFKIGTVKQFYKLEVQKDDFPDILALAEEDAAARKLFKKDCNRIELVNIETIP